MESYAIVTGGGAGVGRSLAQLLSQHDNISVLIAGRKIETLKEAQAFNSSKIQIIQADVGTHEGRLAICKALPQQAKVTCLVHNAAIIEGCELRNVTLEDWRYQMAVNVEGPLFLSQLLLSRLVDNGRILHISSGFAHMASHGLGAYCVSKAALFMAYKCLAIELGKLNVHVGSLRPGLVDTSLQEKLRSLPSDVFPDVHKFQSFPKENKLQPPSKIAKFIEWVIFNTDNKKFSEEEWNIADAWHQEYWAKV